MTKQEFRSAMINEMVEAGDLINKGGDFYEDMGGHLIHELRLDHYIEGYLKNMSPGERIELIKSFGGLTLLGGIS